VLTVAKELVDATVTLQLKQYTVLVTSLCEFDIVPGETRLSTEDWRKPCQDLPF